jgi:hypothetical protein
VRTITIAALNVVLPAPHRPSRYAELWTAASSIRGPVKLRGDTGGFIGSARHIDLGSRNERFEGDFFKFINIDTAGKWLDLRTGRAIDKDAVDRQVRIPENLRPNLRMLPYVFFPRSHRLVFVSHLDPKSSLSPSMARSLVEQCVQRADLVERFGKAEVTVEPDRETLRKIFSLPRLKTLRIEVSPPNALADVERRLFRLMDAQNADRLVQEYESKRPDGLRPTEDVKELAEVAQSNGVVSAKGVGDEGRVVSLSTEDHPHQEKIVFNPRLQTALHALLARAGGIVGRLLARERNDAAGG